MFCNQSSMKTFCVQPAKGNGSLIDVLALFWCFTNNLAVQTGDRANISYANNIAKLNN